MTMGGSPGRGLRVFLPVPLPEVIDVTRTGRRAADLRTCLIFLPFVAGGSADMVVLILVQNAKCRNPNFKITAVFACNSIPGIIKHLVPSLISVQR